MLVATKEIPACVDNLAPDEFSEEVVLTECLSQQKGLIYDSGALGDLCLAVSSY